MRNALVLVAAAALLGTILPAVLYLAGSMELGTAKRAMLIATVVWAVAAPLASQRGSSHRDHADLPDPATPASGG